MKTNVKAQITIDIEEDNNTKEVQITCNSNKTELPAGAVKVAHKVIYDKVEYAVRQFYDDVKTMFKYTEAGYKNINDMEQIPLIIRFLRFGSRFDIDLSSIKVEDIKHYGFREFVNNILTIILKSLDELHVQTKGKASKIQDEALRKFAWSQRN